MPQRVAAPPRTAPYWAESASISTFPSIDRDLDTGTIVVGGGITGLTAAYLLAQAGRRVTVLERQRCAQIDTGHTSAHLTMVTDEPLSTLIKRFGRDHAQAAWDGGLAAVAQIDAIVREHEIQCGFEWVDAYLHLPASGDSRRDAASLEEEASLARGLGFDAWFEPTVPLVKQPGVRFANQARFHPRKYLAGLVKAITAAGGAIFEHSSVDEFCGDPLSVKANGHTATCGDIVLATHNPLVGVGGLLTATAFQTKLALYTSYVIGGRVAKGTIPDALFWDTQDPYHYLRVEPHRDHDVVIFGGEDHKTGQAASTSECYENLERTLTQLVPGVEITHRWSGQVIETPDGLPYIGRTADHQYAATGFAGNGMTFGTLGGMMMADAILGRPNPWTDLFEPGRMAVRRGAWEYIKENIDYPYYLIRDRFAGAKGRSAREVRRGQGKVVEQDGTRIAVYRDASGATMSRSATCTHMGCIVEWNDAERTWDCPCHGSRFKPNGDVISGPAESPLATID
jgi:glycine/D-amino acid oxidase-like deaminating enzyme/nitrite reductase/ring-hydroxylating ferredoxin subunit